MKRTVCIPVQPKGPKPICLKPYASERDPVLYWKAQFFDALNLTWKDVQEKLTPLPAAVQAASALKARRGRARLMQIDTRTGSRTPLPEL